MNKIVNETTSQLITWLAGAQKIIVDHFAANYPNNQVPVLSAKFGGRYAKIIRTDSGRSVHAFIDLTNGAVLKPAGWNAPAKHSRGNIFDHNNGLAMMGVFGPAYLRN